MINWLTFRGRSLGGRLPRLLIVALALALLPASGQAAEPAPISNLRVDVWPEYDDPGVLVMYVGELASTVSLPRVIRFRVQAGATVNASCSVLPDGKYSCETAEVTEENGYAVISYQLTALRFQMEYYYKPLDGQPNRNFTYRFETFDPVDKLTVAIQQPLKASGFTVNSTAQPTRTDDEGFNFYDFSYSSVTPDKPVPFQISYTKTDPNPSKPAKPGSQAGGKTGAGAPLQDSPWLPLILGGVVMAGLGFFAYLRRNRRPAGQARPAARAVARQAGAGRRAGPEGTAVKGSFCTNCGMLLDPGNRFCPECGTKAKRPAR